MSAFDTLDRCASLAARWADEADEAEGMARLALDAGLTDSARYWEGVARAHRMLACQLAAVAVDTAGALA